MCIAHNGGTLGVLSCQKLICVLAGCEYQVPFLCSSWRSAGWRCLKWESWSRTKFKVEWKENWSPSWGWLGARGGALKHKGQTYSSATRLNPILDSISILRFDLNPDPANTHTEVFEHSRKKSLSFMTIIRAALSTEVKYISLNDSVSWAFIKYF